MGHTKPTWLSDSQGGQMAGFGGGGPVNDTLTSAMLF